VGWNSSIPGLGRGNPGPRNPGTKFLGLIGGNQKRLGTRAFIIARREGAKPTLNQQPFGGSWLGIPRLEPRGTVIPLGQRARTFGWKFGLFPAIWFPNRIPRVFGLGTRNFPRLGFFGPPFSGPDSHLVRNLSLADPERNGLNRLPGNRDFPKEGLKKFFWPGPERNETPERKKRPRRKLFQFQTGGTFPWESGGLQGGTSQKTRTRVGCVSKPEGIWALNIGFSGDPPEAKSPLGDWALKTGGQPVCGGKIFLFKYKAPAF